MKILGIILIVLLLIVVGFIIFITMNPPKEIKSGNEDERMRELKQRMEEQEMYENGIRNW